MIVQQMNLFKKKAKRMDRSHFGSLPKLESFRREEVDRFD
jgi:hypothetical protein